MGILRDSISYLLKSNNPNTLGRADDLETFFFIGGGTALDAEQSVSMGKKPY